MTKPSRGIQLTFFFIVFGLLVLLGFFIFKPYINALVLAATFAIISFPLYKGVLRAWRGKMPGLASVVVVLVVGVLVLAPLSFLGVQVFQEATTLYADLIDPDNSEINPLGENVLAVSNPYLQKLQEKVAGGLSLNFEKYAQSALSWIIENAGDLFERVASFALMFFIWLIAFYYFLRDGKKIAKSFVDFSPLSDKYDKEIVSRVAIAVRSTIGGSLIVALLQGILAGIGFQIFGVPSPALWGMLAIIAALVPTIGTAIVTIPAAGYLLIIGHTNPAIGMLIWSLVIVGLVDNILRPKLIERNIHIHSLVILLSVLGGIALFGPVGFIIGPIIVTLLAEFLRIYQEMIVEGRNKELV